MQYGNHKQVVKIKCLHEGLNRTMQYGNSVHVFEAPRVMRFKSYYVVWKLRLRRQKTGDTTRFKSYYVVWKLYFPCPIFSFLIGLNRTMQYGNIDVPPLKNSLMTFKSYYVVWKPHSLKIRFLRQTCLNRTMQYGNKKKENAFYAEALV